MYQTLLSSEYYWKHERNDSLLILIYGFSQS